MVYLLPQSTYVLVESISPQTLYTLFSSSKADIFYANNYNLSAIGCQKWEVTS